MSSLRQSTRRLRLQSSYILLFDKRSYIELDTVLGNKDGQFDLDGKGVSSTLKNASTFGLTIYGELLCDDGSWQRAEIDLNTAVFGGRIFPELINHLDSFIGNINGQLTFGSNFMKTARAVRILGDALHAELQHVDGSWSASSFELSKRYHEFPRLSNIIGYNGPTSQVDITTNMFLPSYISLATSSLALVGDCTIDQGWVSSSFSLETITYNQDNQDYGKLVIKQNADQFYFFEPQLVGTKLSTVLMGLGSWKMHRSNLDLECVLEVEQGAFKVKSTSSFCSALDGIFYAGALRRQSDWFKFKLCTTCKFCDLLRRASVHYEFALDQHVDMQHEVKIRTVFAKDRHHIDEVQVCFDGGRDVADALLYSISDRWDDSMHFRTLPRKQVPLTSSGATVASEVAMQWLEQCVRKHKKCTSLSSGKLPERVLHITDDQIRLVQTDRSRPYACLSYCWGVDPPKGYTLIRARVEEYTNGISISKLPRTIADVIHFTRLMGLDYIWVDALCIVQDESHDWEVESARMKDYYANCLICIAATSSPSCTSGSSIVPLPPVVTAFGDGRDGLPYQLAVMPIQTTASHFGAEELPLLTRGWAYQERRLAPRILHFCKHEIMFECAEGMLCECGGLPQEQEVWTKSFRPIVETVGTARYRDLPRTAIDHSIMVWQADVRQYSLRALTYVEDKLPALSGLAKLDRVCEWNDEKWDRGTYLAGLWTNHLPFDLMWRVGEVSPVKCTPMRQREPYRAPSWSWASVTAPVEFWLTPCGWEISKDDLCWQTSHLPRDNRALIDVHDAGTTTGLDPTGRVSGGFLNVTGRLVAVDWSIADTDLYAILGFTGIFFPDIELSHDRHASLHLLAVWLPVDYGLHYGEACYGVFYLVLENCGPNEYTRVGSAVGRCQNLETASDVWEHFPAMREAKSTTFKIL